MSQAIKPLNDPSELIDRVMESCGIIVKTLPLSVTNPTSSQFPVYALKGGGSTITVCLVHALEKMSAKKSKAIRPQAATHPSDKLKCRIIEKK